MKVRLVVNNWYICTKILRVWWYGTEPRGANQERAQAGIDCDSVTVGCSTECTEKDTTDDF